MEGQPIADAHDPSFEIARLLIEEAEMTRRDASAETSEDDR